MELLKKVDLTSNPRPIDSEPKNGGDTPTCLFTNFAGDSEAH